MNVYSYQLQLKGFFVEILNDPLICGRNKVIMIVKMSIHQVVFARTIPMEAVITFNLYFNVLVIWMSLKWVFSRYECRDMVSILFYSVCVQLVHRKRRMSVLWYHCCESCAGRIHILHHLSWDTDCSGLGLVSPLFQLLSNVVSTRVNLSRAHSCFLCNSLSRETLPKRLHKKHHVVFPISGT